MKAVLLFLAFIVAVNAYCSSYSHQAFYYSMCANTGTTVKSLSVGPSPIVLGNNITISFSATLGTAVTNTSSNSPFSVALHLYKDEVFWVDLCDFVNCNVPDICAVLQDKVTPETCSVLKSQGLPCNCPINAGNYAGANLEIKTHNPNLSWLTNGEYCAAAQLSSKAGLVACIEVYAQLSSTEDGKILIH